MAGGTLVAQAIPVAASPLLTRLYAPAEFGLMALYLSLVAVGAIASTGRYELAILIPADDDEARSLLHVSIGIASLFALATAIAAALIWLRVVPIAAWSPLGASILLVPLGIFATAAYQSIAYWLNRHTGYRALAASRVMQSGSMIGSQLGAGAIRPTGASLIVGHLLGQLFGIGMLIRNASAHMATRLGAPRGAAMWSAATKHSRFPRFLVLGHIANVLSSQLPVLMLATLHSPVVAGLYALAERVLVLPSSLIGSAVGDVYRQRAAAEYHERGNCRALYLRTVRHLALLSAAPCLAIALVAPQLFAFAFGDRWLPAGEVATILAGMVFFQMISSPLSQTVYLANMHRLDLAWQLLRLLVAGVTLYAGSVMSGDFQTAVAWYAIGFATMYALHSLMQYRAALGQPTRGPHPQPEPE